MKQSTKEGFTLLEMLVVVLIIVLLAGLVFRLVGAIGKSNDIAETRAKIEKVSHALEEFKAIYGKYPPVPFYHGQQQTGYEFPTEITWGENSEAMAKRIVENGKGTLSQPFEGIINNLNRRYHETQSASIREELEQCMKKLFGTN